MKNIKRVLALLLSVIMVISLAACAGGKEGEASSAGDASTKTRGTSTDIAAAGTNSSAGDSSAAAQSDKPIELTVYSQLANFSGEQQGWSAKLLKDKFNVVINIVPESDGVFDTRMESGNLGDIVVIGSTGSTYQRAVKDGMLLDWNKYNLLDTYGSYIKEHMPMALKANSDLTKEITDGASDAIYGIGHGVASSAQSHEQFFYTWDVRWDLYKQLGYPVVKDLDDLVTLFEQMKQINPTDDNGNPTYAVSIWPDWDGNMVMYVKAFATAYWGYDEMCLGVYDPSNGVYHDALEPDGPYLTSLKFFNTLYQKGLLDPNSMSATYDSMIEKLKAGGVFFSIFNYAGSMAFNTDDHLASGKYMYTMVPKDAVPTCYGMSVYGGNRVWCIGANTEYPDLCMQIINYMCTPDGYMEVLYGPKDLCWYYDEDGRACFTEFGAKCNKDKFTPMTPEEAGDYAGGTFHDGELQINNSTWSANEINPNTTGDPYDSQYWRSVLASVEYDIQKDWIEYTGCETSGEYMETLNYLITPASTYAESARSDEFDVIWKKVTQCIVDYSWNAIYASNDGEFNYIVNSMIAKAKAYGYDQCKQWSIDEAARRHELEVAEAAK